MMLYVGKSNKILINMAEEIIFSENEKICVQIKYEHEDNKKSEGENIGLFFV